MPEERSATPPETPVPPNPATEGTAAPASVGESDQTPAAESAPPPDYETFAWDKWNGESYDVFPENVRPWAERLTKHQTTRLEGRQAESTSQLQAELEAARKDALQWKAYYMEDSDSDPRIEQMAKEKAEVVTRLEALQAELESARTELESTRAIREQDQQQMSAFAKKSADRYADWFEKAYAEKIQTPAGKSAAERMVSLLSVEPPDGLPGIEPHQAFDIALAGGQEATNRAAKLLTSGVSPDDVHELLLKAYPAATPAAAPTVTPRASADLVAGAQPAEGRGTGEVVAPPAPPKGTGDPLTDAIRAAVSGAIGRR